MDEKFTEKCMTESLKALSGVISKEISWLCLKTNVGWFLLKSRQYPVINPKGISDVFSAGVQENLT